jgi:hypothetical protein
VRKVFKLPSRKSSVKPRLTPKSARNRPTTTRPTAIPASTTTPESRRKPLLILGGAVGGVLVFLLGLGIGSGDRGAEEIAAAEASASAVAAAADTQVAAAEAETAALAEAQAALEAAQAKLATDQEDLGTRVSAVARQEQKVTGREEAVKAAEAQVGVREAEAAALAESAEEATVDEGSADTGGTVYYENCDAARADGAAPVYAGDPGYASHLDRDGDGVGCE